MSLPEGTTIEAGKFYRRRDGVVAGPAVKQSDGNTVHPWTLGGLFYRDNGTFWAHIWRDDDLVAEVPANDLVRAPAAKLIAALLPVDSQERKNAPVYSGVLAYFPRALTEIAKVSKAGNDKHNPGQPLHWSKDKSNDHADCAARHLLEHGTIDADDGCRHSAKLAWRTLALLETELENEATEKARLTLSGVSD